jgi:hypothetical protein
MSANAQEIKRRETAARAAFKHGFNPFDERSEVALFISHHLEEIESVYWEKHFSVAKPDPRLILDSLVLRSHWGGNDGQQIFDFTLPEDVTNYVISVSFNNKGEVADISMES